MEILALPIFLILFGILMGIAGRPKRYKWWIGYRTLKACKTQEAWVFANWFFGTLNLLNGFVSLAFFAGIIMYVHSDGIVIGDELPELFRLALGASALGFILTIILTQVEMTKRFDKDGIRKQRDNE